MKKENKFQVIQSNIKDTSEAKRGKRIYYRCIKCNSIISSVPSKNIGCDCGNVFIDKDYCRLSIDEYKNFEVIEKI
mgnify:CR=1 FL=1